MKNKKEMLRKAAAFVSAMSFLYASSFSSFSTAAEDNQEVTSADTTETTTSETQERYSLTLRVSDNSIRYDRQQDVLNTFVNSEIGRNMALNDVSIRNESGDVYLEGFYECVPSRAEAVKNSILSEIASYNAEYTIGEELYSVIFNNARCEFVTEEYYKIEGNANFLDTSEGSGFRGLKEYNGTVYVKRGSVLSPSDLNLKKGYYAVTDEEHPTDRKIVITSGFSPQIGYYDEQGGFHSVLSIKLSELTVKCDTNDVWLEQNDQNLPAIDQDQKLTLPWLMLNNTFINIHAVSGSDIKEILIRNMNGNGTDSSFDINNDNSVSISLSELIRAQFSESGKTEFTNNAEYTVSISGIRETNTADRTFYGTSDGPETIELPLLTGNNFHIPYLVEHDNKIWYLNKCNYNYDFIANPDAVERDFTELYENKLKNGNTYLEVPYLYWNAENNQTYKIKTRNNGTLFDLVYKIAAPLDETMKNKVIDSMITSAHNSGIEAGRRNNSTVAIKYQDSYSIELSDEFKDKTFLCSDDKGNSFSCNVETVENEDGTFRYVLNIENDETDRPEFYRFMLLIDGDSACPMTPFIVYFDNALPSVRLDNLDDIKTNGWSAKNSYTFKVYIDDPASDVSASGEFTKDAAEKIGKNSALGSVNSITIGDVTIDKPADGWDAHSAYEGNSEENGGYKVRLLRSNDAEQNTYFTVTVSMTGGQKGFNRLLPVIVTDNAGLKNSPVRIPVKIDIGKPEVTSVSLTNVRDNIVHGSKMNAHAEFNDKFGNSPSSFVTSIIYRFEKNLAPDSYTNEYTKAFIGNQNDIRTEDAPFDFTDKNLKGYIIIELTDDAGNSNVFYYCNDEEHGNVTDDPQKAQQLIIDNISPSLPVIHDNSTPDAYIDGRNWFRDYHNVGFSVKDDSEINSGISTVGISVCGHEKKLDISELGFGTTEADIANVRNSLADGGFYVEFIPETNNTLFVPHLRNHSKSNIDIPLTDTPVSLDSDGKLSISFYTIDNAGNRCIREGTSEDIIGTSYYIDNNKPVAGETFTRASWENENSVRMTKFGTFANRRISIEADIDDNRERPSSGLKYAELTYKTDDGETRTFRAERTYDGKAVFSIPETELTENQLMSGTLTISAKDEVGNSVSGIELKSTEGSRTVTIEDIPPVLPDKPEIKGENKYIKYEGTDHEEIWFSGDSELKFDVEDEGSGIAGITITPASGRFTADKPLENKYTDLDAPTHNESFTLNTDREIDGEFKVSVYAEDNAGNPASREYKVFKDNTVPTVTGFRFDEAVSNYDNDTVAPETKGKYSHFADKTIPMTVRIADSENRSSGIRSVCIELKPIDGEAELLTFTGSELSLNEDGSDCEVTCNVPEGFKGDITAWAEDNVGNISEKISPNGFISEDITRHEGHVSFKVDLPDTDKHDADGLELFKDDVTAKIEISDPFSGIQQISWITSDMKDWETVNIDMAGNIVGDAQGWKINESNKDRNIAISASNIIAVKTDANNDFIMLRVKDNTGHVTTTEKRFSIDKKIPTIDVTGIDRNEGVVYYNTTKNAHIVIAERNFSAPKINGETDNGFNEETKVSQPTDDHKYSKDISFSSYGRYELNIDVSDLAGNNAEAYRSGTFVIDTISPKANITVRKRDGSEIKTADKPYIETEASASVTIDEVNFDPDSVTVTINGTPYIPSNWSGGTSHTANIPSSYFSENKEYTIVVSGHDLAGNTMRSVSASFTVDRKEPEIKISGITNANKGDVTPVVNITDDNLNAQDVKVYKNGELLNVTYEDNGDVAMYDVSNKGNYIVGRWSSDNVESGIKKKMVFDNFPVEEKYDGNYKIEVDTSDKAENTKSDSMEFSVNRFGSVFTVADAEKINGQYLKNPPTIVITEKNVDKHKNDSDIIIIIDKGSKTVKLTADDYTVSEPVPLEDGSGYEYTYNIASKNFDQDLNYNISIQSVDEAGNKNVSSSRGAEISFNVDTHNPDFKCDDLADRAEFNEAERIFRLNVNEKLKSIKVTTSTGEVLLDDSEGNDDNIYTFSMPASNSSRDVTIELVDLAGNKTTKVYKDMLITENVALFVMHKTWAKVAGIAAAVAVGALAGAYIIRKRWRGY